MNLDRAPFASIVPAPNRASAQTGIRTSAAVRFVVPALAGPGLTVGALLTAKPGPAKAGTTNGTNDAGISAHGFGICGTWVHGKSPGAAASGQCRFSACH